MSEHTDSQDSNSSNRRSRGTNKSADAGGSRSSGERQGQSRRRGGRSGGNSNDGQGKPRIGDSRPAPRDNDHQGNDHQGNDPQGNDRQGNESRGKEPQSGGRSGASGSRSGRRGNNSNDRDIGRSENTKSHTDESSDQNEGGAKRRRRRGGRGRGRGRSQEQQTTVELDEATMALRRGKERDGRPIGRYLMAVHVHNDTRHIAILEGRTLVEYYVSRPTDDATQIHGNVYMGRVQNVLPGMEAAFVDIATPKNAVLYRSDVRSDEKEYEGTRGGPRIEQMLRAKQMILTQVVKNPIAHKGARLTQEVSLPGRFVVLVPNSDTYGISKRLADKERARLRKILDKIKPKNHGLIVRTAAENVTAEELELDLARLLNQWEVILADSEKSGGPRLLHREPDLAVRLIREEFTKDFRGVVIDDQSLFEEVSGYMNAVTPALAERIEHYDPAREGLDLFEKHHVYEQLQKALDKKVWLPSGGSLIIEHTEALTVIDVNTGKNVGRSSLEDTVYKNNVEAAREVARQLRLRDIGGIIVIDFVDMENRRNRAEVVRVFREELARDKTRTQVYDISDLGLVEMTRKRIGEGLLESVTSGCFTCASNGLLFDDSLFGHRQAIPGPSISSVSTGNTAR